MKVLSHTASSVEEAAQSLSCLIVLFQSYLGCVQVRVMLHCPWIVAVMPGFNDRVKNLSKHLRRQENLERVCSITETHPHSSSRQRLPSAGTTDRDPTARLGFGAHCQPEHTPTAACFLAPSHAGVPQVFPAVGTVLVRAAGLRCAPAQLPAGEQQWRTCTGTPSAGVADVPGHPHGDTGGLQRNRQRCRHTKEAEQ